MGLHQDRDEEELSAPVVSLSLGDAALFRVGGLERNAPTRSFRLASGDAMSLAGEGRLAFHGVDRIIAGSSTLHPSGRQDQSDASAGDQGAPDRYFPLDAGASLGAAFGPPLETPTIAGRSTRSPIVQPLWTTWETVPAGTRLVGRLENRLMKIRVELLALGIELLDPVAAKRPPRDRARSVRRPRSCDRIDGSALARASAGRCSSARDRLSTTVSMSRAKLVTP